MSVLMQEMSERALQLGVPLSAQLDLTYRCNEAAPTATSTMTTTVK